MNLHEKYSKRYRIGWDESRPRGGFKDPQLMTLRGRRGHVYVDGDKLCAALDCTVYLVNKVKKIPGVKILQYGDDGINFSFSEDSFRQIAKIIQLYRRKKLSEAHKEKLRKNLQKVRGMPQ